MQHTGSMSSTTLSLRGVWRVRSSDGKYELDVDAPGSLFEALERSGAFGAEGLFFRENNRAAAELARRNFVFSREIDIAPSFLPDASARVLLEADGLDTLATIRVNGAEVARTANMHRRYRFDVGALLRAGSNRVEIEFADAPAYIEA